ncbi:MAG: GNAT family N-acetyltransferase [Bacteroidales bacterium]
MSTQNITLTIASEAHLHYVGEIEQALYEASQQKGTAIAVRSAAYLSEKIGEGKAVIAFSDEGKWAGFCYIESWGHNKFVANSGLIVASRFRGIGLASAIKKKALELSKKLFPGAKLFGLTTSLAVMKINSDLGYRPVTFSELTDDEAFWKGCQTCPFYDILVRTKRVDCLCTAMILIPREESKINGEVMTTKVKVNINHT